MSGATSAPSYQEQFGGKRKARQAPQPEVTVADVVADLNDVLNWMADLTWADVKRALKYVTVIATIAAALYLAQQIYLLF